MEKAAKDAPYHYGAAEADAWASGYTSAINDKPRSPRISKTKREKYDVGLRVHFEGEAPGIGSGWRIVVVTKEWENKRGEELVRIREVSSGRTATLRRKLWRSLSKPTTPNNTQEKSNSN